MITSLCKKSTQALNYLARKKDGKINKLKAVKIIYFADKYHLRKYGRPVIGDTYWAMKYGPVGSNILNTANLNDSRLEKVCLKYAQEFLAHPKGDLKAETIISKKEVNLGVFSQTDIEALETAFKEFGDKDQFELAEISHEYPEWARHKKKIENGKKSVPMDYSDFFLNPRSAKCDIFQMSEDHLDLAKSIYQENKEVEAIFA